ncbi:MAG: KH domain-containing protein [Chloroflexota bacterium]|nr:KH domain-containing protein [Chloroflexota bacterium]
MKDLIEYIAKSIVDKPDEVEVREHRGPYIIRIDLSVNPEEKGKVIGHGGKIARALRAVVNAAASREGKRGVLEID